jgi:site-specific DNA-methyltransferase (adenine-specific)
MPPRKLNKTDAQKHELEAFAENGGVRRTIKGTNNPAVVNGAAARNNGRYNGDGRHWATPPEVFDPLHAEFDFTLDPCATPESAKCKRFFTEVENGLVRHWSGERVFMNPPYGREVYAWTRKAREESAKGALVVGLLPASTDLKWWHEDVVAVQAEVRYIRGRVRFLTDGPYRASGFFPSVVVVWRPMDLLSLLG